MTALASELAVGLVACGKSKRALPASARLLYTSDLFTKASSYAERTYDRWFVLSAKHGLVVPETVLEPYDLTLADLTALERRQWAQQVAADLDDLGLTEGRFYLHAGALYRQGLERLLPDTVLPFGRPLPIGKQKAWYRQRAG